MKHLVSAVTPILVAAVSLPALAAHTPVSSESFQEVKKAEWGVMLPDPKDLLLDTETPDVLFDGLDIHRAIPVKTPRKSAKAKQAQPKQGD